MSFAATSCLVMEVMEGMDLLVDVGCHDDVPSGTPSGNGCYIAIEHDYLW